MFWSCFRKKLYFPEDRKSASSRHEPKLSERGLEPLGRAVFNYSSCSDSSSTLHDARPLEARERRTAQREGVASLVKEFAGVAASCDRKRAELRIAWDSILRELVREEVLKLSAKNYAKQALQEVIHGDLKS